MDIFEEYQRRHGLQFPIIKRTTSRLLVLLRSQLEQWKTHWVVYSIQFHPEAHQPGWYQVTLLQPVRQGDRGGDGYGYSGRNGVFDTCFRRIGDAQTVQWDEYEAEILKAAQRADGLVPIQDPVEATLAMWEMFCFIHDESLAACLTHTGKMQLCRSIDYDCKAPERIRCVEDLRVMLDNGTNLRGRWKSFADYCGRDSYAGWFADLHRQLRDDEYRSTYTQLPNLV